MPQSVAVKVKMGIRSSYWQTVWDRERSKPALWLWNSRAGDGRWRHSHQEWLEELRVNQLSTLSDPISCTAHDWMGGGTEGSRDYFRWKRSRWVSFHISRLRGEWKTFRCSWSLVPKRQGSREHCLFGTRQNMGHCGHYRICFARGQVGFTLSLILSSTNSFIKYIFFTMCQGHCY